MTKKELIEILADFPDDADVVIEVHDTALFEDCYDFTVDPISWLRHFKDKPSKEMHEIRLCPLEHVKQQK